MKTRVPGQPENEIDAMSFTPDHELHGSMRKSWSRMVRVSTWQPYSASHP
jgi:hypothetical protein